VLVVGDWQFMVRSDALCSEAGYSRTTSSGTSTSGMRIESGLVV